MFGITVQLCPELVNLGLLRAYMMRSIRKKNTLVESDTIFLLCKCYFKELLKWYLKHI